MEIEEESTQMGEKNEAGVRIVIEKGAQDTLAVHNLAGSGFLDGLHGAAAVQGVTEIEVLPIFQQATVGSDLSLQLDLDIQQGFILLGLALPLCPGLGQFRLQVQQDPVELLHLHGVAGFDLPEAVL